MIENEEAKNNLLGYTIINMNDEVEVRLTDRGRDIYFHRNDELIKLGTKLEQYMPKEVGGWFKCQLWELMQTFGPHISMGFDTLFETTIRIKHN